MITNLLKQQLDELAPSTQQTSTTQRNFDEIELTEAEIEEALRAGRESKFYKLRKAEYMARITSAPVWGSVGPRELFEALRSTRGANGIPYQVTDWNRNVVYKTCLYFSATPNLDDPELYINLDKGIMIIGPPGVGKTHLMNFFCKNPHKSYQLTTCKDLVEKFRTGWNRDDKSVIEYYSGTIQAPQPQPFNHEKLGICFGDLGAEELSTNYGNKRELMEEIIFNRYEAKIPFNLTHITTNLTGELINQRYGSRTYDRIKEMFNIITLNGPSFRS